MARSTLFETGCSFPRAEIGRGFGPDPETSGRAIGEGT